MHHFFDAAKRRKACYVRVTVMLSKGYEKNKPDQLLMIKSQDFL
jgi:hypothetical protein